MRLTRSRDRPPLEQWSFVVLISLLSAGLWFGWFGWDAEYQYDADTGARTGPYEMWQGVGAFLCAIVVVALAYRLLHFAVAVLVIPASFTLAWISTASATDESGLWGIGAILVAVGTAFGTAGLLGIAGAIHARMRHFRELQRNQVS